jgi:ketosteroid isomerase-like protein
MLRPAYAGADMTDHPNAELVRSAYEALAGGDPSVLVGLLADDVKWHLPGRHRFAGDFEGRDELLAHWATFGEATGGAEPPKMVAVLGDDNFAIAIEHVVIERNEKRYDRHDVIVFRVKAGRIAEGWVYPESQYEIDDLLS